MHICSFIASYTRSGTQTRPCLSERCFFWTLIFVPNRASAIKACTKHTWLIYCYSQFYICGILFGGDIFYSEYKITLTIERHIRSSYHLCISSLTWYIFSSWKHGTKSITKKSTVTTFTYIWMIASVWLCASLSNISILSTYLHACLLFPLSYSHTDTHTHIFWTHTHNENRKRVGTLILEKPYNNKIDI